ncbi:uncharacterized protein BJ212DRAFT_1450658 [Suillus subaureus]|uniref:CxC2-like cysteine cluster KDZ transposase-associated domain-containing protein n=1 Tax=Suillus subaureus TaxID=48587 RepID=A0A9P7DJS4_9AGAM|nr:uncharacterized protein BJ212DRAFT_1450658 [Suillus subaureus]KAG1796177.1 hypothetical protein BJ212DRAFT_1450658 [Suillus subaureus]
MATSQQLVPEVHLVHRNFKGQEWTSHQLHLKDRQTQDIALEALRDDPALHPSFNEGTDDFDFDNVWNGTEPLPISHTGGKFNDLTRDILGDTWKIEWAMTIIDVYFAEKVILKISPTDNTVASALVCQGVLPCSPISPVVGITTEALELYHLAHLRSPHLLVQAFVKMMSDLHGVAKALQWDSPDWRVKHTCLACSYTLANEELLTFKMLYAMDGNNSLKRIHTSDHYLSCTFIDQFTQDLPPATGDESTPADNLCEGHWKNMDDVKTKRAWGIYDETGVFVAVCCHGFCLLIADMVQSGELAKYPLAVVARLLDMFGDGLGGGYDIGCQFKVTLDNSSLGPLVCSLHHTCLVRAFHRHAHRHLCQLYSLTTYIKGLGIEDLETCKHTFSKSNSLALSLHYASIFHWQQAIDSYFEHNNDFKVYANLSNFLHNNYKQALDILANGNAVLPNMMQDLGVTDDGVFEHWLDKEKAYPKGLMQEPKEETLQIEYWQRLVNLKASSMHCHVVEGYERNLKLIQVLECKLEVITCWVPEDAEWQKARNLVANRKYQWALDHLEGLVVVCIFELTKMNRAGTALQTRSLAIRSVLNTYNTIATAMSPPQQTLKWEEVVDYAFLSDFDLLCNMHEDVLQTPWATPGAHSTMDLYFKMCQAQEEISHLNIEICCLDNYLRTCEDQLKFTSPALAHQLTIHHNTQGRFNVHHLKRLHNISTLPGFSGTLLPGESTSVPDMIPVDVLTDNMPTDNLSSPVLCADTHEDLDEEEEEEEMAEEASRNLQDVLLVTDDFAWLEVNDSLSDST